MLEMIAIDWRCTQCGRVRRVDANLSCTVAAHLPGGWRVLGTEGVVCGRCTDEDEAPTRPALEEMADSVAQNRAKASAARLEAGSTRDPFASRSASASGDLTPPTKNAPVPMVSDRCNICGEQIDEDDPNWRADAEAAHFARVHTRCHRRRAEQRAPAEPE